MTRGDGSRARHGNVVSEVRCGALRYQIHNQAPIDDVAAGIDFGRPGRPVVRLLGELGNEAISVLEYATRTSPSKREATTTSTRLSTVVETTARPCTSQKAGNRLRHLQS